MSIHVRLETVRRSRRAQVYMSGELVVAGETVKVTIRDLSSNGVLIVTDTPLAEQSRVELRRGALIAPGHVAWVHGSRAGVKFDKPVPAHLLEKTMPKGLVKALNPASP